MAVSVLLIWSIVDAVEKSGASREPLFRAANLDPSVVERSDARIPMEAYDALLEAAMDATADEAFGLHLGEAQIGAPHGVIAGLVGQSPSLREGIESLVRFHRMVTDRPAWRLDEHGSQARLVYDVAPGPPRARRSRSESTLTSFFRMLRAFSPNARPDRVSFEYEAPPHIVEYERIFEGTARFSEPFTGIVFAADLLDEPQGYRDSEFRALMESQAERQVLRIEGARSHTDRIRDYLADRPAAEYRDMDATARALGTSVRSLRRRLSEESTNYSDVVESAFATLAKRLLDDGRSIEQTAYEMGFSTPSAFHRAFKRWVGNTPSEYRKQRGLRPTEPPPAGNG